MLQGEEAKPVRQLIQRILYWKAQGLSPEALTDAIEDFLQQSVASEDLMQLARRCGEPEFMDQLTSQALRGSSSTSEQEVASTALPAATNPVAATRGFAPVATHLRSAKFATPASQTGSSEVSSQAGTFSQAEVDFDEEDTAHPQNFEHAGACSDPSANAGSEISSELIRTSNSVKFSELDVEFFDELPEPTGPRFSFDPLLAVLWVYGRIDGLIRLCSFDYLSIPKLIVVGSIAAVVSMPFWIENPEFDKATLESGLNGGLNASEDTSTIDPGERPERESSEPALQISDEPRVDSQAMQVSESNFLTSKIEQKNSRESKVEQAESDLGSLAAAQRRAVLAGGERSDEESDAAAAVSTGSSRDADSNRAGSRNDETTGVSSLWNSRGQENQPSVEPDHEPTAVVEPTVSRAEQDMIDLDRVLSAAHKTAKVPTLDEIASMIDSGQYQSAISTLNESRQSYDTRTADLLTVETLLRMGDGPSKVKAWTLLQDQPDDLVSNLMCARLLLSCTLPQRLQLVEKQEAAGQVQHHYRLWAVSANAGQNKRMLGDLKELVRSKADSACLDCVFLANAHFAIGDKPFAHRALVSAQSGLESIDRSDASTTEQWLVAHSIGELSSRVQKTIAGLASQLTSNNK